jgi:hypothetical protein
MLLIVAVEERCGLSLKNFGSTLTVYGPPAPDSL